MTCKSYLSVEKHTKIQSNNNKNNKDVKYSDTLVTLRGSEVRFLIENYYKKL